MRGDSSNLDEQIETERELLHEKLMSKNSNREEILNVSCELDKYIVEYYKKIYPDYI